MKRSPSVNELIVYRKRREPTFGVIRAKKGDEVYYIITEDGKHTDLKSEKIIFNTGIYFDDKVEPSELRIKFRKLRKELEDLKKNVDLKTLWECVKDENREISFEEFVELYEGSSQLDAKEILQLFWAIDKDDTYFKRSGSCYVPLTDKEVKEKILKKEIEEKRKREIEAAIEWARSVLEGKERKDLEFDRETCISSIKRFVIQNDFSGSAKEYKKLFTELGIKTVEDAVDFLIKAGYCNEFDDPSSIKLEQYQKFSSSAMEETARILSTPYIQGNFRRFDYLPVISIDDETTKDRDDAISFRIMPNGYEVAIHISNVSYYINKNAYLDKEALCRGESIYLPDKTVHMFPEELVEGRLSLVAGKLSPCLTLFVEFDKDFKLLDYRFEETEVKIDKNLSYKEAEFLFASEDWACLLKELSFNLREKRIENGAFVLQLPELKFYIDDSGKVEVKINRMDTTAHTVVSELMILTNNLTAKFLRDRKAPCLYRTQPEPVAEDARALDINDPLYPLKVVKFLRPSRIETLAGCHCSLGVGCYTQVTSPIRRYLDLVMQRQLVSLLEGDEPCYTEDELEDIVARVKASVSDRRQIVFNRKRYWLLKYLKDHVPMELLGYVSSIGKTRTMVYIPQILTELPVRGGVDKLKEGEKVRVVIEDVDPLRKKIYLKLKFDS